MTDWRSATKVSTAVLISAVAILSVGAPAMSAPAPSGADSFDKCSDIVDPAQRLECFDAVQRARGKGPAPELQQQERRRKFGLPTPRLSLPHISAGKQDSAEREDRVGVELAEVGRTHDGMLWIRTKEGVIWKQNDPTIIRIAPSVGGTIEIRRAAMGGYFCDMTRWQSVRCERSDTRPQ